jgi:hypothetical protein
MLPNLGNHNQKISTFEVFNRKKDHGNNPFLSSKHQQPGEHLH